MHSEKNSKIGLHGGEFLKKRVQYSAFSVSFCSASAKNFHFGASLVKNERFYKLK